MGIITRHAGAPFANGETLSGADLEEDIGSIVAGVNGNLDDANISSLSGNKITDASIPTSALVDTPTSATGGIQRANLASTVALTSSTSYIDIPSLTGVTLTPAAATDTIMLELQLNLFGITDAYIGFSIAGTDYTAQYIGALAQFTTYNISFAMVAGDVSAKVCKPRAKRASVGTDHTFLNGQSSVTVDYNAIFRAWLLPAA